MLRTLSDKPRWRAVILRWAVVIVTGIVINLIFEVAHIWLFDDEPLDAANFTTAVVAISVLSGFLAHFAGGYAAGSSARASGGLHGAMVAILGFAFVVAAAVIVSAIVMATAGIVLVEGLLPYPSRPLGLVGGALLASVALLTLNTLGEFFGGKLG
jgi:hypothetical protein